MIDNQPDTPTSHRIADTREGKHQFSYWKVIVPVLIGVSAVVFMFYHDAQKEDLASIWSSLHFTPSLILFIILAWIFMMGRDLGLTWRFRALTDKQLKWRQALKVDLLCEFTSCVTPSAVGGSSMGMVFLNSQGIEFGRATTLMITTLFLDELFFVISCPVVVLLSPVNELFASGNASFSHGVKITFWIVYAAIAIWTLILFLGIIVWPTGIKKFLISLFRLRWLRRWQPKIDELADNMVATSGQLRNKPFRFWLEVFGATALSWTSRYMVVNALFLGFLPQDNPHQWIILARQFVIWVVLMVSPTPGGSGLSEWLFSEYYGDLVPTAGMALILAIFWRIISYYIYLLLGALIVPKWLSDTFGRIRHAKTAKKDV